MQTGMELFPEPSVTVVGLRLFSSVLTTLAAFAWLRFADVREGQLDRPSVHHRVYLRILIGLSVTSIAAYLVSVALTMASHV